MEEFLGGGGIPRKPRCRATVGEGGGGGWMWWRLKVVEDGGGGGRDSD